MKHFLVSAYTHWFDSPVQVPHSNETNREGFQVFKDYADHIGRMTKIESVDMIQFRLHHLKLGALRIHMQSILTSAVYSINTPRTMSGFIDQIGREPTPNDKCHFEYEGQGWIVFSEYFDEQWYYTKCKLVIDNAMTKITQSS